MTRCRVVLMVIPAALLVACGGNNTGSTVDAPGAPPSAKTRALEGGSALLQEMPPAGALDVYVNGFHFYNGNMRAQMEAHHYCSILNEDLKQCILFDGNGADAKSTGVEYIVSRRLFETLPLQEKRLWHSHVYEVESGQLIAPGVPEAAEHAFMEETVGTPAGRVIALPAPDRAAATADGLHFSPAAQRIESTCHSPISASFSPAVLQPQ